MHDLVDVDRQKSICMTEKCVHTAATILAKMDKTVDPCDDFYKFVCGSFIKNAVIPDEKAVLTSFSLLK
jgi:membrane metallo-endopeptidase-like protein 1